MYLYLGNVDLTQTYIIAIIPILKKNQNPEKTLKQKIGANQPPKKKIVNNALINNIFEYSAKKNNAKIIAEYSGTKNHCVMRISASGYL